MHQPLGRGAQRNAFRAGGFVHGPQRCVADTPAWHIDDPLERQVVRRLHGGAHIGDGVADFLAFVKPQPADHAVGHADHEQSFFKSPSLETGAHQHGDFRQLVAVAAQFLDPVADHAGLFIRIPQADDADFLPLLRILPPGAQGLAKPPFIMRDQTRCGGQDGRGGAVVGLQPDDLRTFKILFEAQDVFHLRAAPGVDGLVVVADAADVAVALGQQPQPEVLHHVGILVLVHQDVAEAAVVVGQHVRMAAQDFRHVQQQIAEIRRIQRAQTRLVGRVEVLGVTIGEIGVLGRRDPGRRQAAVLPALDQRHQRRRRPAFRVQPFGFHHLFQQPKLVVGVQDGEVGGQADQLRVPAQHPRAQRVEGAEPEALDGGSEDGADAFAHLARGLVGEGDRQDLTGEGASGQQDMGEAGGQHACFAGAGAGQHQQRPVNGFHRRALFGVQAGEVVGGRGTRHRSFIEQFAGG